jgi:NAD(P)-dependent dehydrogenase (short-subunit alcohol dehydrogenase family)
VRIIIVGGTGTIGREVTDALRKKHEVVTVGHSHGDLQVDIASKDSIRRMFDKVGSFDALVSTAGVAASGGLSELTDEQFELGLDNKLMGQVNLVRLGLEKVRDGGSFTLTSGVLAEEPSPKNSLYAMVNGAINSFGRAAALDMPRKVRLNVVSPPWVTETLKALGMDLKGGMPAAKVALAFVSSVEGTNTGKVIDARRFA